jgi:hypothetical protein
MGTERSVSSVSMASAEYAGYDHMAPPELAPRPRIGGAGNELAALMQGLMGAQANDRGIGKGK